MVSPLLEACCYVVADAEGRCVVLDPGAGVVDPVRTVIDDAGWRAVGVLVTHGHVDHTWSAGELCAALDLPLLVHRDDVYRIDDPIGSLGPLGAQLAAVGTPWGEPVRPEHIEVIETPAEGSCELDLDGFVLTAHHAPGHTEGSTVYVVGPATAATALTGDVLFAGTIGRTDLPGGDPVAMGRTLTRLRRFDPATTVLPGHGPSTTIGAELTANPWLR